MVRDLIQKTLIISIHYQKPQKGIKQSKNLLLIIFLKI